jgi:hypothetical protein
LRRHRQPSKCRCDGLDAMLAGGVLTRVGGGEVRRPCGPIPRPGYRLESGQRSGPLRRSCLTPRIESLRPSRKAASALRGASSPDQDHAAGSRLHGTGWRRRSPNSTPRVRGALLNHVFRGSLPRRNRQDQGSQKGARPTSGFVGRTVTPRPGNSTVPNNHVPPGGTEAGAVGKWREVQDPDLVPVIDAWPTLPDETRRASFMAMTVFEPYVAVRTRRSGYVHPP